MASAKTEQNATAEAVEWREKIRDFHLTGRREQPAPPTSLASVALAAAAENTPANPFPLHLRADGAQPFQPVGELLAGTFEPADVAFIVQAASNHLQEQGVASAPLIGALRPAIAALVAEKQLDDEAAAKLEAEAQRRLAAVSNPGLALAFAPQTPVLMHAALVTAARLPRRAALLARLSDLADHLDGMLLGEAGKVRKDALSSSLGAEADRFIDPGQLAKSVKRTSGHRPLGEERRERVQQALKALRRFLDRCKKLPLAYAVTSDPALTPLSADKVELVEESDPFMAAMSRFDQLMVEWESGLRAARLAELEIEGVYDAERHERVLARFGWRAAAAVEMEAAPAFLVVETAARVAENALTSLGRLLRSGRPVQALILRDASRAVAPRDGLFDLPYLAMAHREALVAAASLTNPERVAAGLEQVSRCGRPAVAVVVVPSATADDGAAFAQCRALQLARVTPSVIYDPDEGETWAERFSLRDNEQPEAPWPVFDETAFTPAAAAALELGLRDRFWVLPPEAWSDEQTKLSDYLANYGHLPPAAVPYIWVEGEKGTPARAVLTRDLANFCRQVGRAWRTYQELAGVHNRYVEQAVNETLSLAEAESAEKRELVIQASRQEGAAAAVYRLVEALSSPSGLAAARASVAAAASGATAGSNGAAASTSAPPPPASAAPPVETAEQELPEPTEPYIESILCTSCNDCINLNPQMFKYNDEKQAYLADPKAGTYKQLLKAAALCPAKCIHAGPAPS